MIRRPTAPRPVFLGPVFLVLALLAAGGCEAIGLAPEAPPPEAVREVEVVAEPEHVVVQHVLISFEGTDVPGATRTRAEAERLAEQVLAQARAGRDFGELVRLYSDDRHGDGSYALANYGVTPGDAESERRKMVRGFGNLAFRLAPGETALLAHDRYESPLGFHVIRRLR